MYYIFRRNIINFGFNDGDEITDELTLLLEYAFTEEEALSLKDQWQYYFYKNLWQYKVLTNEQSERVKEVLELSPDDYSWERKLSDISFDQFKVLEQELNFDFTQVVECKQDSKIYLPLIKHEKFSEFGLDTIYYHDLSHFPQLLSSSDENEAFEKALYYILLTNDVSAFIGDPETTVEEADFLDSYYDSRKSMLDYFGAKRSFWGGKGVPNELISKHGILKFWILQNPYHIEADKFESFFQYKNELLGDKVEHFNGLVRLFRKKQKDLIEIINGF